MAKEPGKWRVEARTIEQGTGPLASSVQKSLSLCLDRINRILRILREQVHTEAAVDHNAKLARF